MQQLTARDPLAFSPFLQRVREAYLAEFPLTIDVAGALTAHSTDFAKMERYVQEYLRYRELNGELLAAAVEFWGDDGVIDWVSYSQSAAATVYSRDVGMRYAISHIAQSLPE